MMFVDEARIYVASGRGGDGSVSFRREANVPQGGPDGGDGGDGGDIIFEADRNLRTLMDFRYKKKYQAPHGEHGRGKKQFGKNGADLIIKVPVGTLIIDAETQAVLKDLVKHEDRVVAAKGGRGGRGNVRFKSSTRRTPKFAEAGGASTGRDVELVLKMIADVGLVGYPNVGKSTLLSVATEAKPKIANYHFTTKTPNAGVVHRHDRSFVIADIPGLIEGASQGLGLGHDFLRHIERTSVLIHVVDVAGSEGRDPVRDFDQINEEMNAYSDILSRKPQIVAANKADLATEEQLDAFKEAMEHRGFESYVICAPIGQGIPALLDAAYELLIEYEQAEEEQVASTSVPLRIEQEADYRDIHIRQEEDAFVLNGKQLEKILRSTNFQDAGSLRYLQRYIEDKGVVDQLKELGLADGDTIRIVDYDFEYWDENINDNRS